MRRVLLLTAIAALALPAGALAAPRYASPTGGTMAGCPQAEPCSLAYAVEAAAANDEVFVTPGTYKVKSMIEATVPLSIHGVSGEPRPRIVGAAKVSVLKSGEHLSLSDLALEGTETGQGIVFAYANGDDFDHLELIAHELTLALRPGVTFTLTNSLLVGDGEGAGGVFVQGVETGTSVLRNDTIYSNGATPAGFYITVVKAGASVTIDATNVISGSASAEALPESSSAAIVLDHSDVAATSGSVTETNAQTAPPVFVDAAADDYREAAGSPTIDTGINDSRNGATDLIGDPRALPGSAACGFQPPAITDIGAYEYSPPTPFCVRETTPPPSNAEQVPQTRISKEKIDGPRAEFRFTGSGGGSGAQLEFTCKLDRRPWRACRSPKGYGHLKAGRHTFRVRAQSGSAVDPTPAERHFTI